MKIHATASLFAWSELEDCPTLGTIRDFLQTIDDEDLLEGLQQARGRGRNDYPVARLWPIVLLTIALRHTTFNATLAELHRNPSLCRLIGIHSEEEIPRSYNLSRFLEALGEQPHLDRLREIFDQMAQRLGQAVDDLGIHTAGDATALSARNTKSEQSRATENEQGLPQACGGRKEYCDESGKVTKVVEWFGYKLHLLVDTQHEVALAWHVTDGSTADNECIETLVDQAEANLPQARMKTLSYDKAADDVKVHELLADHQIRPVIENRQMWKDDPERPLPGGKYPLHVVHDEAGTVYCYDTISDPPVRHTMTYQGYEPDRDTLKYRCPARAEGFECPRDEQCNGDKTYGLSVRIPSGCDRRRFPPIPRATKKFERLYRGRTAVERVNARLKIFWGADDGNVTGSRRFHARTAVMMIVHLTFATLLAKAPRWEGTLGQTRIGTVAEALNQTENE